LYYGRYQDYFPGEKGEEGNGGHRFSYELGYSGLMKLETILMKEFLDASIDGKILCKPFKLILILSINT
jgi:hypothetical protein